MPSQLEEEVLPPSYVTELDSRRNQNGLLAQFINKFSGSCDQNIYVNRVKTS